MIKTKNTEKATAVNLEACGSTFSGRSSFQRTVSVMPLLYDFEDELRTVAGATNWQVASMGPQLYATDDHGLVPSSPLQWSRSLMPRMIDIDTYWSETPFLASMEPQLNATDDPSDLRARIRRSQGFNGAAA